MHIYRQYSGSGRLFTCGDIHGMYDRLLDKLKSVNFDFEEDRLYALGDLADRGTENLKVVELLDQPWFESIRGNHEDLAISAFMGDNYVHINNGGMWFDILDHDTRQAVVRRFRSLPHMMTIETPTGRKIGLVHADMVGADWDEFIALANDASTITHAMWSRQRAKEIGRWMAPITGVDHVYFGHTVFRQPITRANMSWIDTGACFGGDLTLVELT